MPRNLTLGKGELHFAQFAPGTTVPSDGYRFIGNCPEFTLTSEDETLDHFDSTKGIRVKDDSITLEVTFTGSIVCDDCAPENLSMFLLGSSSTVTVASATGATTSIVAARRGRSYQLGVTTAAPMGVRGITSVVVTSVPAGTTYVAGTVPGPGVDYIVDLALGWLTITENSTINNVEILVTYNVAASTRQQIRSGQVQVEGAVKFISFNPRGPRYDYFLPYCKFSPNGDLSLITDEWLTIPFSVEALRLGDLEVCYLDGRPV